MYRKIQIVVFIFCLLLPGSLCLFAQPAGNVRELSLGNWVSGMLRVGEEQWFSVRTTGTGFLAVETSGETDTFLEAYDASRTFIGEDDDSGLGYNARVEIFAEAGRTYLFKLKCYGEDESGEYRIMSSFDTVPPDTDRNTERSRAIPIQPGQNVPVFFRSFNESRWYRCNLSVQGMLFTAYTRGNLDTILVLYDTQGGEILENDDSGEGTNARLSLLANSGTMYIEVKTYEGRPGRSALYAEIREGGKPDTYENDDEISSAKDIRVGESQERTFTYSDDVDWVRLRITQPAVYEIKSTAADGILDSYLELYDSNENLIDEDDDSGGDFDALISTRLNPGTYYIKVYCIDSDPLDDNRYTLSVQITYSR